MANIRLLRHGDTFGGAFTDVGTYSGGGWEPTLPLTSLQETHPKKVARSVDLDTANTRFVVDLLRVAPISLFWLGNHNVSNTGTIRFRASNNADGSAPLIDVTIDRGDANVPWGSLPWGAFPWNGLVEDSQPGGRSNFYQHASDVFVRYVLTDIDDPLNTDGYSQAGRFMAGSPFIPTINMAWGAGLRFVDDSQQSRAASGTLYSDVAPQRRAFRSSLEFLSESEAYGSIYNLKRAIGKTGGLLMIYDSDDAVAVVERRMIYGTLTELAEIVSARFSANSDMTYSWSFAMEELV